MATKRIKFIKPWNMTPAGAEMELDAPVAELLINRGRAKEVQAPAPTGKLKRPKKSRGNKGK